MSIRSILLGAGLLLAGLPSGTAAAGGADADGLEFPTRPGWVWLVPPVKVGWSVGGDFGVISARPPGVDGWQCVLLSRRAEDVPTPFRRIDAALFDSTGARVLTNADEFRRDGGGVHVSEFWFDARGVVPRWVGIEESTPEGLRMLSEEALRSARAEGLDALPLPVVGEPFALDLDLGDGGSLRAADLAGRVVLVDMWATWCPGCMAAMPWMLELHEKHHADGLAVVGVNFDFDPEKARAAVEEKGLAWPHVYAGATPPVLDLWRDATGMQGLPRYLVIDRKGVLRWDGSNESLAELPDRVERLLAE